jgi:hypothetical protein
MESSKMHTRIWIGVTTVVLMVARLVNAESLRKIEPLPLPDNVVKSICDIAARSDVLMLGEIHGTKEVPAVAVALLPKLAELNYGVLALEVPADYQEPLTDWVSGKRSSVPNFYAKPGEDGRGSIESLSLIRAALSPPYSWRLICFDQSMEEQRKIMSELAATATASSQTRQAPILTQNQMLDLWRKRDAAMATNFSRQFDEVAERSHPKVLAICGNFHNRIANRHGLCSELSELWPSFAAILLSGKGEAVTEIGSISVVHHRGGFFNRGKVNSFSGPTIQAATAKLTPESDWSMALDLPVGTPATYLSPPNDENALAPAE